MAEALSPALPRLGQGTWRMGEDRARRTAEIDSLRAGIELGMTLIDTAEMYGDGASETLVGEAIAGQRDRVTLVSKVLPSHASRHGVVRACHDSLRRLRVDRIDVYLLHWMGGVPLDHTIEGFELLKAEGAIGAWGVSNLDTAEMERVAALGGPGACATNQVLYNLEARGIEFDLIPAAERLGIPVMAYSPVGQGGALLRHPALREVAARLGTSPAQVALAWTLRRPGMVSIPKAGTIAHVRENAAAATLELDAAALERLDRAFPPPTRKTRLEML